MNPAETESSAKNFRPQTCHLSASLIQHLWKMGFSALPEEILGRNGHSAPPLSRTRHHPPVRTSLWCSNPRPCSLGKALLPPSELENSWPRGEG